MSCHVMRVSVLHLCMSPSVCALSRRRSLGAAPSLSARSVSRLARRVCLAARPTHRTTHISLRCAATVTVQIRSDHIRHHTTTDRTTKQRRTHNRHAVSAAQQPLPSPPPLRSSSWTTTRSSGMRSRRSRPSLMQISQVRAEKNQDTQDDSWAEPEPQTVGPAATDVGQRSARGAVQQRRRLQCDGRVLGLRQ